MFFAICWRNAWYFYEPFINSVGPALCRVERLLPIHEERICLFRDTDTGSKTRRTGRERNPRIVQIVSCRLLVETVTRIREKREIKKKTEPDEKKRTWIVIIITPRISGAVIKIVDFGAWPFPRIIIAYGRKRFFGKKILIAVYNQRPKRKHRRAGCTCV